MARKPTPPKPAAEPKAAAKSKPTPRPKAGPPAGTVFRLKITLDWLRPAVWRRVEVPDCTLWDLHAVVQACMPWDNSHLWEFTVGKAERYGMGDDELAGGWLDEPVPSADTVRLSDLAARGVKKVRYTYDFGDGWDHTVAFEKPVARDPAAKYPRVVAGARACPPDDCGGPPGYLNLLDVLADKKHPDHKDVLAWAGGRIDPEAFDPDALNQNLRRLKLK